MWCLPILKDTTYGVPSSAPHPTRSHTHGPCRPWREHTDMRFKRCPPDRMRQSTISYPCTTAGSPALDDDHYRYMRATAPQPSKYSPSPKSQTLWATSKVGHSKTPVPLPRVVIPKPPDKPIPRSPEEPIARRTRSHNPPIVDTAPVARRTCSQTANTASVITPRPSGPAQVPTQVSPKSCYACSRQNVQKILTIKTTAQTPQVLPNLEHLLCQRTWTAMPRYWKSF